MKATIYFIYHDHPVECRECEDTVEDIENSIRYWMKKSPGMFQIREILVVPEHQQKDWSYVIDKMRDEEIAYEEEKRIEAEKREYERLKSKYGN